MKVSQDPASRAAMVRQLLASQKRVVIFGQAPERKPARRSQSVRTLMAEAIVASATKRQRFVPDESVEDRAQRARNVAALVAALKRERGLRA
jgi:uncharacterized Rossmann fold enzyme